MIVGTTTATVIKDGVLWVIIIASEIVFRWIPAVIAVATGGEAPVIPDFLLNLENSMSSGTDTSVSTGVIVEGTYYDGAGTAVPIPTDGSLTTGTGISPVDLAGSTVSAAWGIFAPLSIFASLILATALIYTMIRFFQVRGAEKRALEAASEAPQPAAEPGALPTVLSGVVRRWARIQEQIASEEENDWRLAILEADIMLDELLDSVGYIGDTIGDKLKQATRGDFKTLDQAWDAHKVRNHIAHRGSTHDLSQREARRVILEYGEVFREFGLI